MCCVLDEAANICRWPELADVYSYFGSAGIPIMTIWQNPDQGKAAFGETNFGSLFNNANILVYLGGIKDAKWLGEISSLVGQREIVRGSLNIDGRGRRSVNNSIQKENIPDVSDLAEWPVGGRSYSPRSAVHRLTGPCRGPKTMSGTTSSAEPHDMGFGSFIERLSMAFHRNPSKDKEFQTIRKAMVFPPNLSADAPAAPVPLPWSDALPPEPPAPPQTASGNVRVEELTIEDGPELERAVAATFAVDGVKDATRYGLTIPFLRWLIAYKAELTAEDFAVVSREDRSGSNGSGRMRDDIRRTPHIVRGLP